jgi:hypothetical protein
MAKCDNCKKPITGKNFGRVVNGVVENYCSLICKANGMAAPIYSEPAKGKGRAGKEKPLTGAALKKKLRPKEADISKSVGFDLDRRTVWNARLQSGALELKSGHYMKFCPAGTPDRIAAPGVVVFFEIKKQDETPAPAQIATMKTLSENGALVFVLESVADYVFIMREIVARSDRLNIARRMISDIQAEISAEFLNHKKEK